MRLVSEPGPDGSPQQVLVSEPSGERYTVRDGIPLLLGQDALFGTILRYQGAYNKAARFYDPALRLAARLVGGSEGRFRQQYLRELGVHSGQRVLEVSVGTGAHLRYLPPGATHFGLDISWEMLARCRENLKKWQLEAELFLGNAEELPFCDETFDVVYHVGGDQCLQRPWPGAGRDGVCRQGRLQAPRGRRERQANGGAVLGP